MADTKYKTDKDGNVIDPPTLPDFEARLRAAHDTGDQDLINVVQDEYTKAREDIAKPRRSAAKSPSASARSKSAADKAKDDAAKGGDK